MTAVNPALPAFKPAAPAGFGTVAANGAGTQANSFLSLLKQSSATPVPDADSTSQTTPADGAGTQASTFFSFLKPSSATQAPNADSTSQTTPADRALKNSKGWDATVMNAASASVAPAQNQPIPFKLSFNIFGTCVNSGNSRSQQSARTEQDEPIQNQPAPASTATLATPAPAPVSLAIILDSKSPLPQEPSSPAADDLSQTETTPAQATTQASPLQIALTPLTGPPVAAESLAPSTATAPVRTDRSRPQKSTPAPPDNSSAVQTMPAVALPIPAPLPANSTPASVPAPTGKADSAASASAPTRGIEPSAEQNRPRLNVDAGETEKPAPSELSFALRLESNGQPAASASIAPPMEIRPSPIAEQPALVANKPVEAQPAATAVQPAQSQAGPNADSGSNAKGDDAAPGNRHGALDLNADQTVAPNPVSAEIPQATAQSVYTPASPAPASEPASAQATQRTSSPVLTPAVDETTKTGPANQISISVPAGDQQKVEVRLMDRAGEVRISVHAPNEELAGTLRQDLGSLTGKLNQSGYTTEAFTPSRGGGEFSRDQKSADSQQQSGSERQSSGRDQQQQSSQQNGRGNRPAWLDELDNSLATAPARTNLKDKN
jgi:hypothetical protein